MINCLIDTNILSELVKPRPDRGVLAWVDTQTVLAVSVVTLDEILFGLTWRPKRPEFLAHIEDFITQQCTVLPVTETIARRAGAMRGELRARGHVREQPDMLIAATAQVHALTLVTRNRADFDGCGIPILNPFSV